PPENRSPRRTRRPAKDPLLRMPKAHFQGRSGARSFQPAEPQILDPEAGSQTPPYPGSTSVTPITFVPRGNRASNSAIYVLPSKPFPSTLMMWTSLSDGAFGP